MEKFPRQMEFLFPKRAGLLFIEGDLLKTVFVHKVDMNGESVLMFYRIVRQSKSEITRYITPRLKTHTWRKLSYFCKHHYDVLLHYKYWNYWTLYPMKTFWEALLTIIKDQISSPNSMPGLLLCFWATVITDSWKYLFPRIETWKSNHQLRCSLFVFVLQLVRVFETASLELDHRSIQQLIKVSGLQSLTVHLAMIVPTIVWDVATLVISSVIHT